MSRRTVPCCAESAGFSSAGQYQLDTVDARVGEPLPGALDGGLPIRMPLGHAKAQPAHNDKLKAGGGVRSERRHRRAGPSALGARLHRMAGARAGVRHRYEFPRHATTRNKPRYSIASSKCVVALDEPPQYSSPTVREMIVYFARMPAPRSRMNSSRSSAFFRRAAGQAPLQGHDLRAEMLDACRGFVRSHSCGRKNPPDTELWIAAFEIAVTIASHPVAGASGPARAPAHE